ncbi:ATP-binding protein [Actinomadura opuntiae]|uniref:ATP-binding protein n=1 Tax=Actinomadura sp. OS1-43 TaxID=604315 RepID=UPI00255ADD93|nr:LuxR C-terminal-related transcriptional regulator [Actinomadura sp. OS1-43]MDL4819341.1 LuxR C-terminal-related transcriptional regulator [Actinomadura sp. OS1-43]
MALEVTLERQTGRLPAEFTSFVGRKTELHQVGRLIDGHRLVTLTGPGGVGKTRLAVRTAARARDAFDGGVYFVGLSSLTEPSLLAQAVCDALGLAGQGCGPAASRLADHLADRRVLLVLDTCEHLLDACAALAEVLLRSSPGLRVLATSRQPLDVLGEHTISIAPLGRPGSGAPDAAEAPDGEECDSVKLFAERAAAAVQGWTLTNGNRDAVVRLCDRLDGIPLAIELAAVQLRTFSADQVLTRLGTRLFQARGARTSVPRHQTLRAAIDWSHALCSAEERLLWARLSVFAGDFDLDAAEHVCSGEGLRAEQVVDVLTGLVDKSVVQRADRGGVVRYRMLDSLREYGVERLAAGGGQARLRRRCFDWYAGRLRRARAELAGAEQTRWLAWFDRERANIRALLGHVLATAETATARDAMDALGRLWMLHGMAGECRHWMDRLLEARDTTGEGWARLLGLAALTMTLQDDLDAARELLGRAAAQARAEGDRDAVALVTCCEGATALFAGDVDRSLRLLGAADELGEDAGADVLLLLVEVFRGVAHLFKGDHAAAVEHAGRGARAGEEHGELWVRSYGTLVGGLALWLAGDLDASLERLRWSLRIKRDLGDELGMTLGLEAIAGCLCSGGEYVRAARLLGASDRMRECTQTAWFGPHHAMLRETHIAEAVGALGERRYRTAFEEGGRLPPAHAIQDALGEPPPSAASSAGSARAASPLTEREREVAALVAEGLSNRDIADRLTIAKRTADSHVEHILAKLGFSSRAQIAVWVTEQNT